jgi:hypothetical protein
MDRGALPRAEGDLCEREGRRLVLDGSTGAVMAPPQYGVAVKWSRLMHASPIGHCDLGKIG